MTCSGSCGARIDLAEIVDNTIENKWQSVSVDLGCFADKGVDFARLTSPFSLHSKGKASISVANIQFAPNNADSATLICQ
jgi:beta-glucosidase